MIVVKKMEIRFLVVFILPVIFCLLIPACSKAQKNPEANEKTIIKNSDPWQPGEVITPAGLNELLKNKNNLLIIQVGFKILFDQDHIPGAVFTGPASLSGGINTLKNTLKNVNRDKNIILYCGCCKWNDCPNIRPAFETVSKMGFKNVKVLYLADTFVKDWEQKGYPVTK
jgi:thiosulfate/3-mercaptopyruvate sulfurtransferase